MEEQIQTEELVTVTKKKSNGQIFKEKNGYSKTRKRLLNKYGPGITIEDLKAATKARKKVVRAIQKDKHSVAKVNRGSKSSKGTKSKGK